MTKILSHKLLAAPLLVTTFVMSPSAKAEDFQTIWVEPGQSVNVYWNINLAGKVYLSADIGGNPACLDYWWIVWPFTQIKSLGRHCGRISFELPGMSDFAIGGKLRAGNADGKTRVLGTATESVAQTFPVSF
ncbi:hypothetical protein [Mesorhizobium sp.]|uniref:hypothetical protein n=1 Tax=Mesorhizobium sp. TaxID=1871066 RepID=UPI000FE7AD0B|nr:hypothetical protein [Mesorhizobium sp.]RWP68183.1 MAG: hypothetical protein EOR07_08185 [Mesorhizobium sp.]